jgi:predicted N-acetyltransferase YhbS
MQIERIEEMRLTPQEEAEIGRLLDGAFDTEFEGRSYFQQRHHVRLVHRRDGRIVGHMALALRAIRMGEALVQVAGLADVATDARYRGQGIGSALMSATIAEARASVAEFLVLFGNRPMYRGHGFIPQDNRVRMVSLLDVRTGEVREERKEGLMVLPLKARDWDGAAMVDLVGHPF